jgi:quercetin dioxygenase-like cupin family protein
VRATKLSAMTKGWFVGSFTPTALVTGACEVAVKHYKKAATEPRHQHRVATEVTLVLYGRVRMAGGEWGEGDIIVLTPGEITAFEAISDCGTVVVKVPGARDDKYFV